MNYVKWLIAGGIGGGIGAVVWILVGYFTEYEVGWIAWGVGLLAGIGTRMAAGEEDGWGPGLAATSMAVASVLVAKYLVVTLVIGKIVSPEFLPPVDEETMISVYADEVAEELEAEGRELTWPEDVDLETAPVKDMYPPEVWSEGEKRWNAHSPEEKQEQTKAHQEQMAELFEQLESQIREQAFTESFTPWDLLWFGLAAFTAFRIGSGLSSEGE
jgi:hypothetical protein